MSLIRDFFRYVCMPVFIDCFFVYLCVRSAVVIYFGR